MYRSLPFENAIRLTYYTLYVYLLSEDRTTPRKNIGALSTFFEHCFAKKSLLEQHALPPVPPPGLPGGKCPPAASPVPASPLLAGQAEPAVRRLHVVHHLLPLAVGSPADEAPVQAVVLGAWDELGHRHAEGAQEVLSGRVGAKAEEELGQGGVGGAELERRRRRRRS